MNNNIVLSRKGAVGRIVFAVAMTAIAVSNAFAADTVLLKPNTEVVGDSVTVGDVFQGGGEYAAHVLAPAPKSGKPLILSSADIQRVSNAFNLGYTASPTDQVVISRGGVSMDRYDIEAALSEELSETMKGKKFEFDLNDKNMTLNTPEGTVLEIGDLRTDLVKNEFTASAIAGTEKKQLSGRIHPLSSVPVLSKSIRNGDVITSADIEYVDMRADDITGNMIVNPDRLIGQTPRRAISALKPVMAADIISPALVKKGEAVTLTLNQGPMALTAQGRALDSGAAGEVIRIVNTSSNQVIEGVVSGPRVVTIGGIAGGDGT